MHFRDLDIIQPESALADSVFAFSTTRSLSARQKLSFDKGQSNTDYAGLNLGAHVGDCFDIVSNNRDLVLNELDFVTKQENNLLWLNQVHGDHIFDARTNETLHNSSKVTRTRDQLNSQQRIKNADSKLNADAIISNQVGVVCNVMTADCVPILVSDNLGQEVAAIHAGWKGLTLNIIQHTLAKFSAPINQLNAWIGPSICWEHFEVNLDIAQKFDAFPDTIKASKNINKFLVNLPEIAYLQMQGLGLKSVQKSGFCSYSDEGRFYSHRRSSHKGHQACGRMSNMIVKLK